MEEGDVTSLGYFEQMPAQLRLWFFARLDPRVLPKLRRNKELKRFIDEVVYPHIEGRLEMHLEGRNDYTREYEDLQCTQCSVGKVSRVGGVKKTVFSGIYTYTFALNPDDLQPSGSSNFSRIDNFMIKPEEHQPAGTINGGVLGRTFETGFTRLPTLGWCYHCVLVKGLPPNY